MSDERKLTEEDREKIQRLLESGTLENVTLALSLIEETAGQEDIADIFTMNVIVELICLGDPLLQAASIMRKCPNTSKVFVEALANPFSMTSRDYRSRKIDLSEFTTFSSSAFAELVNAEYDLNLNGLTSLSNVAAECLSKHEGSLNLDDLTELSDAAAEGLSKHEGKLYLSGLTSLSDGPGHIALAERVSKCDGNLNLNGLTELSDAAVKSLSKHERSEWGDREGDLYLNGLTELSDAAAKSLCKHDGDLYLNGLTELSDTVAVQLASHNNLHTSTKIKRQIIKAVSTRNQQARKSERTGETALTKKQATKIRKLLRTKTSDNALLAVQLINDSEVTKDDISDVFSASMISLFVNTWDVDVWNALAPLLLEHQVQRQELTDLVRKRFPKISLDSRTAVAASLFNRAAMPLVPLIKECQILSQLPTTGSYEGQMRPSRLTELSDAGAQLFVMSADATELTELRLDGLTELTDAVAESLSKHEGALCLSGLTSLSDAAAKRLGKFKGTLNLSGLTELSDAAAESLSKHAGNLNLNGLTSLSDAAAESLSKHEGELNLGGLASLSDGPGHFALAESLSKHEGELNLDGLTSLSDAIAESLSKHEGSLNLDVLTELSDAAAENLSKHGGELYLSGLTSLSDGPGHIALAESLSKNEGELYLKGLTELSDAAAESLSKHGGRLYLSGLTSLSDAAAESLSKHKRSAGPWDTDLSLGGLTSLSEAAAKSLSKHEGNLSLGDLPELSDDAARSLAKRVDKFRSWQFNFDNLPASAAQILRDAGHGE